MAYKTASEYWKARKAREKKAVIYPKLAYCRLCGSKMTGFGGCCAPIGKCPNAYTD